MIDIFVATNEISPKIFLSTNFFSLFLLSADLLCILLRTFLKTNTTTQRADTVEINDTIISTAVPY